MTYVDSTADGQKKFVEDVSYHDISCSNDGDIASHAAVIATGTCYRYLKPEKKVMKKFEKSKFVLTEHSRWEASTVSRDSPGAAWSWTEIIPAGFLAYNNSSPPL
ncbi:hypothetical protein RRG08_017102 [Elysia crispata]|uniref:Uncharacterized protein n=1 Tax=Elysia crispata TaxID=231223 RepID=A0AAE0ZNC8_9GAST|nr:hypothetical protein RRG08_017102 [Elysia crispata]